MSDTPELIPRLTYSKNWEDPADYATHQRNEVQNRKDMQSLFTEIASYLNDVMIPRAEQLISESAGSGGSGSGGTLDGDYLPLSGGTMRGILRLYRAPQLDAEAATKQYVDSTVGDVAADVNGNLTAIRQDAEEIELLAQNNEGDIASLKVRADEIQSRVETLDGNVSTVTQTANALESRVTDAEGNLSDITQTVHGISLGVSTVTDNGEIYSRIQLKIGENNLYGYIKMDGNVNVSGQLSAEALYAGSGEVANLAVDTLLTSRRIVRYLSGDTSDDNFIRAYGQNVEWVTGACNGGTTQATEPDGSPLYWPVDVSGLSRGSDGYPVTGQGERVFTTTTPTAYPVMVYSYTEDIKRSISFEHVNGIYSPIDRFGAGNQQGNNKAWILKTADGFDIRYLTPDNKEIGIRMATDGTVTVDGFVYDADKIREVLGLGDGEGLDLTQTNDDGSTSGMTVDADGYVDVEGLRKVTNLNFSTMQYGYFSETLDGGILNTFQIERDGQGRIVKMTDASGHETAIKWE